VLLRVALRMSVAALVKEIEADEFAQLLREKLW